MFPHLSSLSGQLGNLLDEVGATATVTFRRINPDTSTAADDLYDERAPTAKIYTRWALKAVVDERPWRNRRNRSGPYGDEVKEEMSFTLYNLETDEIPSRLYIPLDIDEIEYRGELFEVVGIERIHPTAENDQLGYRVDGKKYR